MVPAQDEGVSWEEAALVRAVEVTKGYPYFLQEFGKQVWDVAVGTEVITAEDIERSVPVAIAELDDGFFRVRTGRTSNPERAYLRAMAELGPGPVRSARSRRSWGGRRRPWDPPGRASSRRRCATRLAGEIEFTVPMFDEFMKRWIPDLTKLGS